MQTYGRSILTVDFYPALQSGAPAPYEPEDVDGLIGMARQHRLAQIFMDTLVEMTGQPIAMGYNEKGHVAIFAPSEAAIDVARNMPFTTYTLEHL